MIYLLPVLIISRLEFIAAAGQYPQGTNALNAFLIYSHWRNFPLEAWFYPWTDWGELISTYTGPNVLYLGALTLDTSTLIRILELGSFWGSGCAMYALLRGLHASRLGAFTAGFYYLLLEQTPQFFEGHVPSMIGLAVAPLFLLVLHRFGSRPRLGWGVAVALLLYLLASIGDLSVLYFLLCFGILLFVYDTLRSGWFRHIERSHLVALGVTAGLFLVLMAPWWLPYAVGVRPKYFTNLLGIIPPFSQAGGENISVALQGIVQENSFSRIVYGSPTYATELGSLDLLYYLVPAASIIYLVLRRSLDKVALFAAGLLGIIVSTAGTHPGLSTFNGFLYTYVPFFNYIPDLRLWLEITVVVYSIFVGWLVTDLSAVLANGILRAPPVALSGPTQPVLIEEEIDWKSERGVVHRRRVWAPPWATSVRVGRLPIPKSVRWILPVVLCGLLLSTVVLENSEAFSSPPVLFRFPDPYLAGFEYIAHQPDRGGILTVPFSAIYERTPWGGVSVSTLVMSTTLIGRNAVVFEGGTPYSAAMDQFVAGGLVSGNTNNVSKFLAGSNIQWITATNYTNWSYSSSGYYSPRESYERLSQQVGLGAAVYSGSIQSVYELSNVAGNVSFHPSYFVYYGSSSLINELTNEPSYNGTQVLLNGSALSGSTIAAFIEHASGLWGNASTISALSPAMLNAAVTRHTPISVVLGPGDVQTTPIPRVGSAFTASNAVAVRLPAMLGQLEYSFPQSNLVNAGATTVQGNLRASCAPGTLLTLSNSLSAYKLPYDPPGTRYQALNLASLGAAALEPPDTINVSNATGVPYLIWTVVPSDQSPQYFQFKNVHNLSGVTGLALTLNNRTGLPPTLGVNLDFNNTWVRVFGDPLAGPPGGTATTYSFNLAADIGPGAGTLAQYRGNLTNIEFGTEASGTATALNVTNLSLIRSPASGLYQNILTPAMTLVGSSSIGLSATSQCLIDTLTLSTTAPRGGSGFTPYYGSQPIPTSIKLTSRDSGWGILQAAQTYDSLWGLTLDGLPAGAHVPGNIGLNSWLVDLSVGAHILIAYGGQDYVTIGTIAEGVGLTVFVAIAVVARVKSKRSRTLVL
ncbi:MAG: hypothetical protein L3K14_00165 [Thermoplasmata archaeon]|nr:hypothetical protein [Thermoplasmata archaeon]